MKWKVAATITALIGSVGAVATIAIWLGISPEKVADSVVLTTQTAKDIATWFAINLQAPRAVSMPTWAWVITALGAATMLWVGIAATRFVKENAKPAYWAFREMESGGATLRWDYLRSKGRKTRITNIQWFCKMCKTPFIPALTLPPYYMGRMGRCVTCQKDFPIGEDSEVEAYIRGVINRQYQVNNL